MKEKVNVTGVPETMVQTLYARAKETKKQNAKIKDEIAVELVEKLDYDFSKADKDKAMSCGVIARTIVLDRMVRQYLEKHENTVVVNIACGLDTRCYRMKEKYLRWYNVDLPETMKIRRQFLPETGPIYQIAKSAMDNYDVHNPFFQVTSSSHLRRVYVAISRMYAPDNPLDHPRSWQSLHSLILFCISSMHHKIHLFPHQNVFSLFVSSP